MVTGTGWQYVDGCWYYLKDGDKVATGWLQDGDNWYYLYPEGSMTWNNTIDGYYLDDSGKWIPNDDNSNNLQEPSYTNVDIIDANGDISESKLQALMLKKPEYLNDDEKESLEYVKNVISEDNYDKLREAYTNENVRKSRKTQIEGLPQYYLGANYKTGDRVQEIAPDGQYFAATITMRDGVVPELNFDDEEGYAAACKRGQTSFRDDMATIVDIINTTNEGSVAKINTDRMTEGEKHMGLGYTIGAGYRVGISGQIIEDSEGNSDFQVAVNGGGGTPTIGGSIFAGRSDAHSIDDTEGGGGTVGASGCGMGIDHIIGSNYSGTNVSIGPPSVPEVHADKTYTWSAKKTVNLISDTVKEDVKKLDDKLQDPVTQSKIKQFLR
jgi:hypothetical protein